MWGLEGSQEHCVSCPAVSCGKACSVSLCCSLYVLPPLRPFIACVSIIFAFQQYAADAELDIARWEHNYRQLSERHRTLLHTLPLKFRAARVAARQNSMFIQALLAAFAEEDKDEQEAEQQLEPQQEEDSSKRPAVSRVKGALAAAADMKRAEGQTSPVDVDKVRSRGCCLRPLQQQQQLCKALKRLCYASAVHHNGCQVRHQCTPHTSACQHQHRRPY